MHGWTFFLLFLSVHSRIVSTTTVKLLCHFGFVCVLILDYAVHIFHSTESRYAIFVLMQKCNCAGSPQTNSHTPWSAHGQHALPYSVHTTASFPIQASTTINIMHNNRVPQRPQDILVNSIAGDKSLAVNDALSKLWSHCHSFELARNVFYR